MNDELRLRRTVLGNEKTPDDFQVYRIETPIAHPRAARGTRTGTGRGVNGRSAVRSPWQLQRECKRRFKTAWAEAEFGTQATAKINVMKLCLLQNTISFYGLVSLNSIRCAFHLRAPLIKTPRDTGGCLILALQRH